MSRTPKTPKDGANPQPSDTEQKPSAEVQKSRAKPPPPDQVGKPSTTLQRIVVPGMLMFLITLVSGLIMLAWNLGSQMSAMDTKLKTITDDVKTNSKNIAAIRDDIQAVRDDVKTNGKDIETIREHIKINRGDIKAVDMKVEANGRKLARLEGAVFGGQKLSQSTIEEPQNAPEQEQVDPQSTVTGLVP